MSTGGVKQPELQADNSLQLMLGLRMPGAVPSTPLTYLHGSYRENCTFFFIISEPASAYDELLLNIDNLRGIAALRKGDWKLIKGEKISMK
jgi:hypothetical protein